MSITSFLSKVNIVLTDTSHPGNIGSAARAMKNMGLQQLSLVNPFIFPSDHATALSAGGKDILHNANVYHSLAEALQNNKIVFGTSARERYLTKPILNPDQCSNLVYDFLLSGKSVAIVFGNEKTGLSNDELDLCHYQIKVPTSSEYSSLNLAAAVQIISYQVFSHCLAKYDQDITVIPEVKNKKEQLNRDNIIYPDHQQLELFFDYLQNLLLQIGFLHKHNKLSIMRKLRRFFMRSKLEENELNIFRGIFKLLMQNFVKK